MKYINKNDKTLPFYTFIIGILIYTAAIDHVLAQSKVEDIKLTTTVYPGLVKSSLEDNDFIQPNGEIIKPLLDFLTLFGIQHEGTVASVNAAMQENFIRKTDSLRWDLEDSEQDKRLQPVALNLLKEMGFVDSTTISPIKTDYYILFGAGIGAIEKRFDDFLSQYNAGNLQCDKIILLGGNRKLQLKEIAFIESRLGRKQFAAFLKNIKKKKSELTETEALRFVWQTKANIILKRKFKEGTNLFLINTISSNETPNTLNTIKTWLQEYVPTPGSCHANVEKPYGIRMEKTLRLALEKHSKEIINSSKKPFSITWNSPAANNHLPLSVYKDELARTFYQECALKKYLEIIK